MTSLSATGPTVLPAGQGLQAAPAQSTTSSLELLISKFVQLLDQLSQDGASKGGSAAPANAAPAASQAGAPAGAAHPPSQAGAPHSGAPSAAAAHAPASEPAKPSTSAGTGPNTMSITNNQDHAITVGKFKNGESTTDPSAKITLQPRQSGTLKYENGEGGYAAQADASGKFQPTASRLEYEADKDGKMKFPDVSYIDGRNASISLTDGAGLNKGDSKSIAGNAPSDTVTKDSGGGKTIAGWYDGSTSQMQAGGAFMEKQLGTSGAYVHPDDDKLSGAQNPMSGTQSSTIKASFGDA